MYKNLLKNVLAIFFVFAFLLGGCSGRSTPPETPAPPTETLVPIPPTPTSLPMAIRINGEGILLSDYQEEFNRLESALKSLGKTANADEMKNKVIEDFIGYELLYQEANKNGFTITQEIVATHIQNLAQSMGGDAVLNSWKQANFYTDESFERFISRSIGAAWQRDVIIKALPDTTEQVHARQIYFSREEAAINTRQKVDGGVDFEGLARDADPLTFGDLGWFPRGYLLQPEIEEAAFSLQPGEVSQVIKTDIGWHLLQVIEKEADRKISPDARVSLEEKAIKDWVSQAKTKSQIDILVP